jgi:hypothetical protein
VYSYSRDVKFSRHKELTHVGGEKHPLRKSVIVQILFKQCKVLDFIRAIRDIGYRVIYDQGTEVKCQAIVGT